VHVLSKVAQPAAKEHISCQVIDLRTIVPRDADMAYQSVSKTSRLSVSHEATLNGTVGAEISLTVTVHILAAAFDAYRNRLSLSKERFPNLEASAERVCGDDIHPIPHLFEPFYFPSQWRCLQAIGRLLSS
jgi:2-oxoisovalerate dehydrogenase E1 component beta subunit